MKSGGYPQDAFEAIAICRSRSASASRARLIDRLISCVSRKPMLAVTPFLTRRGSCFGGTKAVPYLTDACKLWEGKADESSAPVQLHHDIADEDVPLAFSQTLDQELVEAGKTVEFYTYPDILEPGA